MRRLTPPLITVALLPRRNSSHLSSVVRNVSITFRGARTMSPCRTVTTMALCEASSDAPADFTSFEVESELSLAYEDLEQLQSALQGFGPSSTLASANTRQVATPLLSTSTASSSGSLMPPQMKPSMTSASPVLYPPKSLIRSQPIVLPPLLQRPRWCNVVHERYTESLPGYVDACAKVLEHIRNMWKAQAAGGRRREKAEGHGFPEHVSNLLRHAHADALLVLLEGVTGTDHGGPVFADGAAPFHVEVILHLVRMLADRSVELSGKHMAHLSKLLLGCPHLLTAAPPSQNDFSRALVAEMQDEVWNVFTCLCYATRRCVRRQQNFDCLEALLCGVYMRVHRVPNTMRNSFRAVEPHVWPLRCFGALWIRLTAHGGANTPVIASRHVSWRRCGRQRYATSCIAACSAVLRR
ncbi:hypothetical protein, unknown function [Leishmania tarentolae]|uniref:Uncharacterized protein n=1 Tax=Leishmania tarentolae TaxID=5689 RepID=A0A640KHE1_LEITA|nr:hypothetical protein, unknown function [Leishmania tarentolae]